MAETVTRAPPNSKAGRLSIPSRYAERELKNQTSSAPHARYPPLPQSPVFNPKAKLENVEKFLAVRQGMIKEKFSELLRAYDE
jgi:hypothetical protein